MSLLWGIVIVIVVDAIAIAAMLFVRRRAPEGSFFTDGDRASGVFGVLATCFAIFAGFVIFLAFTTYDQSLAGAEAEALTVVQQFETAQFLAPETRDRLTGELVCYSRSVVAQEWPRMEAGDLGDTINPWSVALFRTIKSAETTTPNEQAAFSKWLDQTSDREEARRDRVHGAAGITPTTLWIVLLLSAGVIFAYMLFFADSARDETLAGHAHRVRDHGRRRDRAGDLRPRQPVPPRIGQHSDRLRWSGRCVSWTRLVPPSTTKLISRATQKAT